MALYPPQRAFTSGSEFPAKTPGRLRIYSMRFCPYAQRTRLVLAHKNIEHEVVNINLDSKPQWFLDRNPAAVVPVLELDDQVVGESTATCEWLDDVYGGDRLTPSDPYRKARDRMLLESFGKLTTCYYTICRGAGDKDQLLDTLQKHLKFYNDALAERKSPYFGGDKPAMIDFFIWPHMERVPNVVVMLEPRAAISKEKFPELASWFETMYQTPAVKATMFDHDAHIRFANSYFEKGVPTNYDDGLEE